MKRQYLLITILVVTILVAACGGTKETPQAPVETEAVEAALSVSQVKMATSGRDAQDLMIMYSTSELMFPEVGFTDPAEIVVTEDALPGLLSDRVWVVQDETSTIWAAIDKGELDLIIVGVDKDNEERILGARPGITSAADLGPESKISGGAVGEYDELVLREILTIIGVDPNNVQIIAMGGGADARMTAMIAGQLDAGIQQPRNIVPLTEAGGVILYNQPAEAVQDMWVVTREFYNEHKDAVCAYVKARVMGKQWAYAGAEHKDNLEKAIEVVKKYAIDPTESEINGWVHELEGNVSLDGGATYAAIDKFEKDLKAVGILSEGFNWRDHADFSCLWEAQEALGLEKRPN